jgi:ketosteroid isomerase-like protein
MSSRTLTTPDFQWSPSMVAIKGETFLGRQGIDTYFGRLSDSWETFHVHPDRFRDSAEVWSCSGDWRDSERAAEYRSTHPWGWSSNFRDGLISRIRGFLDHAKALEVAGLAD